MKIFLKELDGDQDARPNYYFIISQCVSKDPLYLRIALYVV